MRVNIQYSIEMDEIPLAFAKPGIDIGEPLRGGATVGGDTVYVDLALESFLCRNGVADGYGVAYDQDSRQFRVIHNLGERCSFLGRKQAGSREKQKETVAQHHNLYSLIRLLV